MIDSFSWESVLWTVIDRYPSAFRASIRPFANRPFAVSPTALSPLAYLSFL